MIHWRQWRKPRTKVINLMKLGVHLRTAVERKVKLFKQELKAITRRGISIDSRLLCLRPCIQ